MNSNSNLDSFGLSLFELEKRGKIEIGKENFNPTQPGRPTPAQLALPLSPALSPARPTPSSPLSPVQSAASQLSPRRTRPSSPRRQRGPTRRLLPLQPPQTPARAYPSPTGRSHPVSSSFPARATAAPEISGAISPAFHPDAHA